MFGSITTRFLNWKEGAKSKEAASAPSPKSARLKERMLPLFDNAWYRRQMPRGCFGEDPWEHYLRIGGVQGLSPHPLFDGRWYLEQYPDVANAGLNPLRHYVEYGAGELRNPSPYFDAGWYLARYPDVAASEMNPLLHYVQYGAAELRDPNPVFDSAWYVKRHPEAKKAGDPFAYFIRHGLSAGHAPGPRFDASWYLLNNRDVVDAGTEPLAHYTQYGRHEGRSPASEGNDFYNLGELAARMAGLPPSRDAVRAFMFMRLANVAQVLARGGALTGRMRGPVGNASAAGITDLISYPPPPYLVQLHDAHILAGTRYVLVGGESLIHDEEAYFADQDGASVKYMHATALDNGQFRLAVNLRQGRWIDSGINVMHEYSNNYFHFLTETLPRIMLAEEAGIEPDVPFLIESALHTNLRDMLDMVNLSNRPLLKLESGVVYRVREMYYPSDVSTIVDAYEGGPVAKRSVIDVGRMRTVIDRCRKASALPPPVRRKKIYATRRGSLRRLLNDVVVEKALESIGFEVVVADGLSVKEQMQIFSEADVLVGPTGAQITNIVWCAPGTKVVVLASDHPSHQLYLWELIGKVSGANVYSFQGPRAYKVTGKYAVHDDYSVDVRQLLDFLSRL